MYDPPGVYAARAKSSYLYARACGQSILATLSGQQKTVFWMAFVATVALSVLKQRMLWCLECSTAARVYCRSDSSMP